MKLQEIKLPYSVHCAFPAAILATCLVILAVFRLQPGRTPLLPPVVTSDVDGWARGNQSSCDIFKGEWVPDPIRAPPYTPETCPVIHGHYDCMRYGRPDLDFLRYRWRPDGCDLPRFDAARFLAAMRGKSMAFVGDSLARNQMHSLVCLLASAEHPTPPWTQNKASSHLYRYDRADFTVALFWSPFLVRALEEDPVGPARSGAGLWRLHLDEPDPAWAARVAGFDVVVMSASSWFYRPAMLYESGRLVGCSGCRNPNVTDLTLRYSLRRAFRTALQVAGRRARTAVVVRTFSPAHYENGTGDCVRTRPLRRGERWEVNALEREMYAIQREEFAAGEQEAVRRREGKKKKKGVRMMLLDATEAMARRPDAHPGRYRLWQPDRFNVSRDCLHWCLPGAMDACNDMLQHMLLVR